MHWIYAHLIGDFLIQTDWMAKGKKESTFICLVHVVIYMVPFLFCGFAWWQLGLIALQHFFQDRTNFVVWFMEVKGSAKFTQPPMAPWSIVLTDNILHILFIAAIRSL
jgi:hypothetical protein